MEQDQIHILLVEDDEDDYIIIRAFISEIKTPCFVLDWVTTYESGLDAMRNNRFAAYLVDYRLGPWSGLDLLREAIASGCVGPIIILTGQGDHEVDMTAMEAGAADYLIKDQINAPLLERSIRYTIRHKQAEADLQASEEKMRAQYKGIPIPTFTWQHSGETFILVDINDTAVEVSGGKIIDSVGKTIEEIYTGGLEDMIRDVKRCFTERTIIKREGTFCLRNTGDKRSLNVSYAFVPPDLVLMHAEDITERKLTDDLLHLQRELAVALSSTSDLTEALNKILETACQIPGFDSGGVYLVDRNSGELNLAVHKGLSYQFVEKVSHYNPNDPSALLIQAGKPVFMSYSNVLPEIQNGVHKNEGLRATAIIPIIYKDQIIAVLNLASHSTDEISDRTRSAIEGIAAQTGEAIARLRAEESLRESQKNFQSLFDTVDDFVFILNREGSILRSNPVAQKRLGYSSEELLGKRFIDLHPPELRLELEEKVANVLSGKDTGWTTTLIAIDDNQIPVDSRFTRLSWDNQEAISCISRDITERRKMEEKLSHQATHDALTGLPNRYLLEERLKQALSKVKGNISRIGVAYFNLDHFKDINETLGHPVGDELLVQVAERLKQLLRLNDTLARMGNDEFVYILNDLEDGAEIFQETLKLRSAFKTPFQVEGRELYVTASIGLSIYPADAQDATTLLKNANTALNFAKAGGKNSIRWFEQTMQTRTLERLELTNRLQRGIEQEEFVLYYQPQIDLTTDIVIGVEALVRWQHPTLGMIPPANFIRLAEESGLINPLGDWILMEACRQLAAWQKAGLPSIRMAVNISPVQFAQSNWVERVAAFLKNNGVKPSQLAIEVTESVFMQDIEEVAWRLASLRELGSEVHIDDFGTAYSSLTYLRNLPVDCVKIDQTYIQSLSPKPDNKGAPATHPTRSPAKRQKSKSVIEVDHTALVNAIITLAHSLKLQVIAEGVETEEQLTILRHLACDQAQGYFFARPAPADQLWDIIQALNGEKRLPLS